MIKRIVTRPDFDGVVCAVLLTEALGDTLPVVWTQPNEVQRGTMMLEPDDVVANLPLSRQVALWFDHHVSNATTIPYKGAYRIAPSAAGLVYEYFKAKLSNRFAELVRQADRIDSAQLTLDEILRPECYPHVLLSMTIFTRQPSDEAYCNLLTRLLRTGSMDQVLADPTVKQRCATAVAANQQYESFLKSHTCMDGQVAITDFRSLPPPVPDGNRFLVYSLFPQSIVNAKIFHEGPHTVIKLGHSIVNRGCRVNVGRLLARYGGGGHEGAGACRIPREQFSTQLDEIVAILKTNQSEEE
ncbi:MAG: exopolyphosphatase [Desulfobacteraceae bacterium]|nr:exopolyphosphatase [Desulfobacteraceae bacterium]